MVRKHLLECFLSLVAALGVIGSGMYLLWPAISAWWSLHWPLVTFVFVVVGLGSTAHKWVPLFWHAYVAITDRADTKRIREQHYLMLAAVTAKMEQGFDTNYKNAVHGFEIAVHNPYMKGMTKIQEVAPNQGLLAPVVPKAPAYGEVDGLITEQRLVLCYTQDGPVFGTILDLLSMCVVGKPGRGKSTALLYYILILLKANAEVWIWDPHSGLNELSYGLNYHDDLPQIEQSAATLHGMLEQRRKLWKEQKRVMHPLLLLIDEMPVIADYENDRMKAIKATSGKKEVQSALLEYDQFYRPSRLLKKFVLEARKWNCYVILSGQALPAEVLNTLTRDNLSSRIVFESCNVHAKMAGLQKEQIDNLLPSLKGAGPGVAVMDVSRWSTPVLAAIPNTTVNDLRAFIDSGRVIESNGRVAVEQSYEDFSTRPQEDDEEFFSAHEQSFEKIVTGDLESGINEPVEGVGDSPITRPYAMMSEVQVAQFVALYPFMGIEKTLDAIEGCNHRHRDHARELIEQHELRRKKA